jgi:hypothetical protein
MPNDNNESKTQLTVQNEAFDGEGYYTADALKRGDGGEEEAKVSAPVPPSDDANGSGDAAPNVRRYGWANWASKYDWRMKAEWG